MALCNVMSVVVTVLCNQSKTFASYLGDDQSYYLYRMMLQLCTYLWVWLVRSRSASSNRSLLGSCESKWAKSLPRWRKKNFWDVVICLWETGFYSALFFALWLLTVDFVFLYFVIICKKIFEFSRCHERHWLVPWGQVNILLSDCWCCAWQNLCYQHCHNNFSNYIMLLWFLIMMFFFNFAVLLF